jgi:hypothetical protein
MRSGARSHATSGLAHRSAQERCEALTPLAVADRSPEHVLEDRARGRVLLPCNEADARDEDVLEQLGIDARHLERTLERPHRALGLRPRTLLPDGREECRGVQLVPVHQAQTNERGGAEPPNVSLDWPPGTRQASDE